MIGLLAGRVDSDVEVMSNMTSSTQAHRRGSSALKVPPLTVSSKPLSALSFNPKTRKFDTRPYVAFSFNPQFFGHTKATLSEANEKIKTHDGTSVVESRWMSQYPSRSLRRSFAGPGVVVHLQGSQRHDTVQAKALSPLCRCLFKTFPPKSIRISHPHFTEERSEWMLVEGCDGVEPSPAEVRVRSVEGRRCTEGWDFWGGTTRLVLVRRVLGPIAEVILNVIQTFSLFEKVLVLHESKSKLKGEPYVKSITL